MKIKITNIRNEHYVEFSSAVGSGIGVCKNTHVMMKGVYDYDSEFDINIPINLKRNALLVSDRRCFIRLLEDKNEIQGLVDQIDEDGMIYLRLAIDCLIMVESENDEIKKGDYLLLTVNIDDFKITLM